jgi:catechol 2,3-dioxygenase-like lactoylglutathione lyase family enzyme
MGPVRVHHVALRTADVARLERFYAGVLGLPVMKRDAARGSVWLDASGSVIMLESAKEGEPAVPAGSMELLAFSVESLDLWRQRLAAVGMAIEGETAHTLYFRDPDGRRVGVSDYSFSR